MANQYNDILASQIAEPATSDENLELYARVAAGDTFARQEMIERNMALVLSRVDAFLQARPGYKYYEMTWLALDHSPLCKRLTKWRPVPKPSNQAAISVR